MGLDSVAFERGKKQSELDIAQGCPRLYWGTRGGWGELLTRLMAERFQVTVEHISDMTTEKRYSFEQGYNEITAVYIDQAFGAGAYQTVIDEVQQYREESYRRYIQSKNETDK